MYDVPHEEQRLPDISEEKKTQFPSMILTKVFENIILFPYSFVMYVIIYLQNKESKKPKTLRQKSPIKIKRIHKNIFGSV